MKGLILKGVGSFYTLLGEDGAEYVCRARGRFRREGLTPLAGDEALFEPGEGETDGRIDELLARRNLLVRPAVANVDKLFIVVSAGAPEPDLLLVDKLLIHCERSRITPLLVINKCDGRDDGSANSIQAQYAPAGYKLLRVSAKTGQGMEALEAEVPGCTCCLAGQSAVGKSSILNRLMPELDREVGGLSRKTERGRHTTRSAELFSSFGGRIVDTPGFSLLEADTLEPPELSAYYPEMREKRSECRFPECMHISEPGCEVKPLIAMGRLSKERYERYMIIAEELKEMQKHRYD